MSSTRSDRVRDAAKPGLAERAGSARRHGVGRARATGTWQEEDAASLAGSSGHGRLAAARRPRRVRSRRLRIRWQRTILAAVVVYVLVTLCAQQITLFGVRRQISQLDSQIAVERERAAILDAEMAYRNTDEYIEMAARRELGLVRPGEIPVINGVKP